MIWGYWGQDFPALPDYDTVLGFNEPNHADQSNLSPEAAAYAWMELQAKFFLEKLDIKQKQVLFALA